MRGSKTESNPPAVGHEDLGPREPNNDMVICPNCTSQFVAIPVNAQRWENEARLTLDRLAAFLQIKNVPYAVSWRDWIDNAIRVLDAYAPQPKVGDEVTVTIPLSMGQPRDGWKITRIDRPVYVFLDHANGSHISLFPGQFAQKS